MQEKPLYTSFNSLAYKLFYLKYLIPSLILIVISLLFTGCAFIKPAGPQKFLSNEEMQNIIEESKAQEEMVSELYLTGTLSIKGWILDRSAEIFIAGKKSPLTLKMEISHSWGKPLFYLLIRDERLSIIDFMEKKQYEGKFTPENLSRFLPEMAYSTDMIWSFLRGYPKYTDIYRIEEERSGMLALKGRGGKSIGTIALSPENGIKKASTFYPGSPGISFNDFNMAGDISYAVNTLLEETKENRDMELTRKKVVFNKDIPDEIFTLQPMAAFEQVSLDNIH